MAVTITYDGNSPWGTTTPFVQETYDPEDFGGTWVNIVAITLNGSMSKDIATDPAGLGYASLEAFRDDIIATFSINGKKLKITDSNSDQEFESVFVDSLSFPDNNYVGKLDYTISLRVYDWDGHAGNPNVEPVLQPTDRVEVSSGQNGTVTITHSVSAQGVDDGDGAGVLPAGRHVGMDWAKSFVNSRINVVPVTVAFFATNMDYIILEESETFDRLTSTYTRTKEYIVDGFGNFTGSEIAAFKRYSATIVSSITDDYETVSLTAEYRGGSNTTTAEIVTATDFESDLHTVAETISGLTLHPVSESISVDQDLNGKSVNVQIEFNNDPCFIFADGTMQDFFFDPEFSVSTDYISGVSKVNVSGSLKVKGDLKRKNQLINDFVNGTSMEIFLKKYAELAYMEHGGDLTFSLSPEPESLSITRNETQGTLNLSASYSDEDFIRGCSSAEWTCNVTASIPFAKNAPSATENGYWMVQYFNFNTREKISVSVNLNLRDDSAWEPKDNPAFPLPPAGRDPEAGMNPQHFRAIASFMKWNIFGLVGGDGSGPYGVGGGVNPVPPQVLGGLYYVVSENENIKQEGFLSGNMSEERSYTPYDPNPASPDYNPTEPLMPNPAWADLTPLISLGVGPPPF